MLARFSRRAFQGAKIQQLNPFCKTLCHLQVVQMPRIYSTHITYNRYLNSVQTVRDMRTTCPKHTY